MRGFGMTYDMRTGTMRNWYIDGEGAKRWVDNDALVDGLAGQHDNSGDARSNSGHLIKSPASEAGCDQPAGEPVPLPEPFGWLVADRVVGFSFCRDEPSPEVKQSYLSGPVFSPARLRGYAETVAAPLRERVAQAERVAFQSQEAAKDLATRLITAGRERDTYKAADEAMQEEVGRLHAEIADLKREREEARDRSRYWKQRAKSAEGHLMASDLDAAARAVHSTSTLAETGWDDLTAIQRATMTRAAALAISTVNARRDARKTAAIGSATEDDKPSTGTVANIPDEELLWRAVNTLAQRARRQPAWARIGDVFCLGSTYSAQLCRRFGRDPQTGKPIKEDASTTKPTTVAEDVAALRKISDGIGGNRDG
jgi:hypothetical protein